MGALLRGTRSVAQAKNASGRVAGSSSTSTGATNAVTGRAERGVIGEPSFPNRMLMGSRDLAFGKERSYLKV